MNSRYVAWLQRQRVQLYKGGNHFWRLEQGALVPALVTPCFIELTHDEAKALLRESGAFFLRYSSNPCEEKTEWWYIVCDNYDFGELSSKVRNQIKRGNRLCSVRQIYARWLANYGYKCYLAAYNRYKNAKPTTEEIFRKNIQTRVKEPFEYWGVFVGDALAGYCQCIVEEKNVVTSIIKYHPEYLKFYSSYALITKLINHYVVERSMIISNGTRSIIHQTSFQNVLLKLGFRKQFCRLNVVYQPWLAMALKAVFPLGRLIARLPVRSAAIHKFQSLLLQEELRRRCISTSHESFT